MSTKAVLRGILMQPIVKKISLLMVGIIFIFSITGCSKNDNQNVTEEALKDKPIADFQIKLLDLAFEIASKIPIEPHIKDRSKAQEIVVSACLELDQPDRASGYIEQIEDWRRGMCYAELALYYIKNNNIDKAKHCANLAHKVVMQDHGQSWRNERIKAKILEVNEEFLRISQKADVSTINLSENEEEIAFNNQIKELDDLVAPGNFEVIKNALNVYARLFKLHYGKPQRRLLIEEKIKNSWMQMPYFIRIHLLADLTESAIEHSDNQKSLELIDEAQTYLYDYQWPAESLIPLVSKLSGLRFKAGDIEIAHKDINAAWVIFQEQRNTIVDISRAKTLRPLAQAYQLIGDTEASLSVYRNAVEEGAVNPNSRPRAEDLSATCCSMALNYIEPDEELWERIHQISKELGHPW